MILLYIQNGHPRIRSLILWQDILAIIEVEQLAAESWALVVNDKLVKDFNTVQCPVCGERLDKQNDSPLPFSDGVLHSSCVRGLI